MKFNNLYALMLICCLSVMNLTGQTNDPIGGAGVCHVDQDPNNISALDIQDVRDECQIVKDVVNDKLYSYVNSTDSWVEIDLENSIVSLTEGNNIVITNTNGNWTINATDEIPSGGASNQILTNDGAGGYTWEDAPATIAELDTDNIDLTLSGNQISGEIIVDPSADNILTSSGAGLSVVNPMVNLVIADSNSDAEEKGVPLDVYFETSDKNSMGMSAGVPIKRKF